MKINRLQTAAFVASLCLLGVGMSQSTALAYTTSVNGNACNPTNACGGVLYYNEGIQNTADPTCGVRCNIPIVNDGIFNIGESWRSRLLIHDTRSDYETECTAVITGTTDWYNPTSISVSSGTVSTGVANITYNWLLVPTPSTGINIYNAAYTLDCNMGMWQEIQNIFVDF